MSLSEVYKRAIFPALALLPSSMGSPLAIIMLLAIGLQESRFEYRRQLGNGPARGLWQFEKGTEKSRGGVWGVYLHESSRYFLEKLCQIRGVKFHPDFIYPALEKDDILAAGVARLLLLTDPFKLPAANDIEGAWLLYAKRTWRPGKPHRHTWDKFHIEAQEFVKSLSNSK